MGELDGVFERLGKSSFRRRFRLAGQELSYLRRKGLAIILRHAAGFIDERLAPAQPPHDGRQTPYRNHPVFVAQHATATCCRRCLEKWHRIPTGRALADEERRYVLRVLERWLSGPDAASGSGSQSKIEGK